MEPNTLPSGENRPPLRKQRPRYVDCCRHCGGVHFNYAEYLACVRAAQDQDDQIGRG
jgi:hypothetical protein